MTTTTASTDDVRDRILRAAEELFAENGFERTGVREIAARAGVSKSLVGHHFGSKEQVWGEVLQRTFREYVEAQQALILSREANLNVFRESIITYFRFLQANPHFVRLGAWMNIERGQCFEDMGVGLTEFGVLRLQQAQERGEIRRDVHPYYLLTMFFCLVEHWFQARAELTSRYPQQKSVEELDAEYLDAVLRVMIAGVDPSATEAGPSGP